MNSDELPIRALRLNCETYPVSEGERRAFHDAGIEVTAQEKVDGPESPADFNALLVVSAKVPAPVVASLTHCRVIARYGTGTDNIDVAEATRRGILVTNVPDFCLSEMADHTMALILALGRRLFDMDRSTRTGKWQARVQVPVYRLEGKTLGLIGFGRIARALAHRAAAFGMRMLVYKPGLDSATVEQFNIKLTDLDTLLSNSDFVSLHLPLTPKTRHLIGERELRLMKPEAYFINTARGGIVDEKPLVRALSEGWIAGAGIDVFENLAIFDPNPQNIDHPLFHLDNVILTPHSGGCSRESLDYLMGEAARQAISVLKGEWPSNCVNPEVTPWFEIARKR